MGSQSQAVVFAVSVMSFFGVRPRFFLICVVVSEVAAMACRVSARNEKKFQNKIPKQTQLDFAISAVRNGIDQDGFEVKYIDNDIGKGVFAKKTFTKGEFLLEYRGDLVSKREGVKRERKYGSDHGSFLFYFKYDGKSLCVDATFSEYDFGRMINDAGPGDTAQNCVIKVVPVDRKPHLCFFATKDIKRGDEIRYDYGVDDLPWRKRTKPGNLRQSSPRYNDTVSEGQAKHIDIGTQDNQETMDEDNTTQDESHSFIARREMDDKSYKDIGTQDNQETMDEDNTTQDESHSFIARREMDDKTYKDIGTQDNQETMNEDNTTQGGSHSFTARREMDDKSYKDIGTQDNQETMDEDNTTQDESNSFTARREMDDKSYKDIGTQDNQETTDEDNTTQDESHSFTGCREMDDKRYKDIETQDNQETMYDDNTTQDESHSFTGRREMDAKRYKDIGTQDNQETMDEDNTCTTQGECHSFTAQREMDDKSYKDIGTQDNQETTDEDNTTQDESHSFTGRREMDDKRYKDIETQDNQETMDEDKTTQDESHSFTARREMDDKTYKDIGTQDNQETMDEDNTTQDESHSFIARREMEKKTYKDIGTQDKQATMDEDNTTQDESHSFTTRREMDDKSYKDIVTQDNQETMDEDNTTQDESHSFTPRREMDNKTYKDTGTQDNQETMDEDNTTQDESQSYSDRGEINDKSYKANSRRTAGSKRQNKKVKSTPNLLESNTCVEFMDEDSESDLNSSGSEWCLEDEPESSESDSFEYQDLSEEKPHNSQAKDNQKAQQAPVTPTESHSSDENLTQKSKQAPVRKDGKECAHFRYLDSTEKLHCVRNPSIFIKKPSVSTKSKTGRSYDIVHACLFCGKLMTNIQKHIENQHKNKEEVKEIIELKKQREMIAETELKKKIQKELSDKQTILKNKGDHKHNSIVRKFSKGELLLSRRRKGDFNSDNYGGCPECFEWIVLKENYNQHRRTCPAKSSTSMKEAVIQNLVIQGKIASSASEQLLNEVFPIMSTDAITQIAIKDPLIVALGEVHFMSAISNKLKRKNYASYRMRLAARLLQLVREEINDPDANMHECLNVEYFDTIAKCSIIACGTTTENELKHPSVAIKLGFDITKMVAAKIGFAAKQRREHEYKDAKRFQSLLQSEWKLKVRKHATVLLEGRRFNKQCELPDPEDIGKLASYMIKQLNELKGKCVETADEYRQLAILAEARLLLYNRRRPGELESLTIDTFKRRSTGINETDLSLRAELSNLEKKLLDSQELVEIRGKGNKRVPVLLPEEVKEALQLLSSNGVREKCGINPANKYLFGTSGMEPIRAGTALDVVKFDADLKSPQRIFATNLRKHTATISQVMGLKDNELRWLVNHMGHTEKVHLQHYRATSGLIERLDIAKVMLMQERGVVAKFAGVSLQDITFEDIEEPVQLTDVDGAASVTEVASEEESFQAEAEWDIEEDEETEDNHQKKQRKTKSKSGSRVSWTSEEIEEIRKYFKDYLSLQSIKSCPGMKEILKVCARSKASGGKIWKRQWEVIKKKVSYLVQKAKQKNK